MSAILPFCTPQRLAKPKKWPKIIRGRPYVGIIYCLINCRNNESPVGNFGAEDCNSEVSKRGWRTEGVGARKSLPYHGGGGDFFAVFWALLVVNPLPPTPFRNLWPDVSCNCFSRILSPKPCRMRSFELPLTCFLRSPIPQTQEENSWRHLESYRPSLALYRSPGNKILHFVC